MLHSMDNQRERDLQQNHQVFSKYDEKCSPAEGQEKTSQVIEQPSATLNVNINPKGVNEFL